MGWGDPGFQLLVRNVTSTRDETAFDRAGTNETIVTYLPIREHEELWGGGKSYQR